MAARLPLLIPLVACLLAGCARKERLYGSTPSCVSCHAAHYVHQATCVECHRGEPAAARKELAHARLLTGGAAEHRLAHGPAVREGARLVDAASCRRCHTIGGKGNRLATNLDGVVARREQPELAAAITAPAESMPTFGFDRGQTESIVAFLLNVARPDAPDDGYRVHFARAPARPSTVFEQRCGGCHRLLGPSGPRGTGDQGPNLSGLFTPFYPPTATGDRPWSASALAEWVGNPRALRATTTMPPVSLTAGELREVTEELGGGALPAGPS